MLARRLAALIAATAIVGCGAEDTGSGDCTAAGCSSGVAVKVSRLSVPDSRLVTLRACVDRRCRSVRASAGDASRYGVQVDVPLEMPRGEAAVTVVVRDPNGQVLLRATGSAPVEVVRPNGPDCPPVCQLMRVRVAGNRLLNA